MKKTSDWRTVKLYDSGSSCPSSSDYQYIIWNGKKWVPENPNDNGINWVPKKGETVWVNDRSCSTEQCLWVAPTSKRKCEFGEWWVLLEEEETEKLDSKSDVVIGDSFIDDPLGASAQKYCEETAQNYHDALIFHRIIKDNKFTVRQLYLFKKMIESVISTLDEVE